MSLDNWQEWMTITTQSIRVKIVDNYRHFYCYYYSYSILGLQSESKICFIKIKTTFLSYSTL